MEIGSQSATGPLRCVSPWKLSPATARPMTVSENESVNGVSAM